MDLVCQASLWVSRSFATLPGLQSAGSPGEDEQQAFDRRAESYAAWCAAAWAEADEAHEGFGASVSVAAKLEHERRADRQLNEIEGLLRQWPASAAKRGRWRLELLHALRRIARDHLGDGASGVDQLFTPDALEATRSFVREARTFAPSISDRNLFQALRNLWVFHSVQLLLCGPIALSPAIFAYSMLYPWTDNCLDDPGIARAAKVAFGDWLGLRLAGVNAGPPNTHAEEVSRLVSMIERLYPRPEFPEVYLCLRAIHRAQMGSLEQQDAARNWDEPALLTLSIAKGGTSVLADACLVRGWLNQGEAEFMFAYGVLLQLMDDLQDLRDDLANKHMTLFTRQTTLGPLDGVTARLWGFTRKVLWGPRQPGESQSCALRRLVQENLRLLLFHAVARCQEFYTPHFISVLEAASPVRFGYLARQEKTLADRYSQAISSVRENRRIRSRFELLD